MYNFRDETVKRQYMLEAHTDLYNDVSIHYLRLTRDVFLTRVIEYIIILFFSKTKKRIQIINS